MRHCGAFSAGRKSCALYVTNDYNSTVTVYNADGVQQTLTGSFPNLTSPFDFSIVP
ncbi:MAG: hypothetical protein M1314_02310 [Firmicutes bacterium]|nr:hypothetical protein [Bacillota bacterium]